MSGLHLQDRKTLVFSNHQSDKTIHGTIGNQSRPYLNGGSLEISIVYLTSLKDRHVTFGTLHKMSLNSARQITIACGTVVLNYYVNLGLIFSFFTQCKLTLRWIFFYLTEFIV